MTGRATNQISNKGTAVRTTPPRPLYYKGPTRGVLEDTMKAFRRQLYGREEMKMKLTGVVASALVPAALVLGGATAASAAAVPADASAVSAHTSVVQPAGSWHLYGYFSTLGECQAAAIELMSYGAYAGYQCSLTDGAHQQEALWVYF